MSRYLMLFNIYCGDGSGWLCCILQDFLFILCVLYIALFYELYKITRNRQIFFSYGCANDLKNVKQMTFAKPHLIVTSSTVIITFYYPSLL